MFSTNISTHRLCIKHQGTTWIPVSIYVKGIRLPPTTINPYFLRFYDLICAQIQFGPKLERRFTHFGLVKK